MKKLWFVLTCCAIGAPWALADTLVLSSGRTVSGTVLQTNAANVLMMTDFGTLKYARAIIQEIKIERAEAVESSLSGRLPSLSNLVLLLSRQPWATNLTQIPATVIDKGMLRNVPYVSFRCGEDYEVNVYGDPGAPAGIEAGVYRKLLSDRSAKGNCLKLVADLLSQAADKDTVRALKLEKDQKTLGGLTFEITPSTAEDAYQGWWVSVYSEKQLELARASSEELKQISVARADTKKEVSLEEESSAWSAEELKLARPLQANTITFTNSTGEVITNAEVVRVVDGVYLIWRRGASGGVVKLAELGEVLRVRFGYDPAKAAAFEATAKEKKAREWQEAQARAAQQARETQQAQAIRVSEETYGGGYSSYSGYSSSSGGGRVYVRGYTRRDGTYVSAHTRSSPRSR